MIAPLAVVALLDAGVATAQSAVAPRLLLDSTLAAPTPPALFHRSVDYGSEASFGVVSLLLNRGLHFARARTGSVDLLHVLDGRHSLFPALRHRSTTA